MNYKFFYFFWPVMLIAAFFITITIENRVGKAKSKKNSSYINALENEKLYFYHLPIQCNNINKFGRSAEHCTRAIRPIQPIGQNIIGNITKKMVTIIEDENNFIWIQLPYLNYTINELSDNDKNIRIMLPFYCENDIKNRGSLKYVKSVDEIYTDIQTSEHSERELLQVIVTETGMASAKLYTKQCTRENSKKLSNEPIELMN